MEPHEVLPALGQRIKQLRLEKGLTQMELAEAIKQDVQYIADVEAGTCDLYLTEIGGLVRKLGIKMSELFPE